MRLQSHYYTTKGKKRKKVFIRKMLIAECVLALIVTCLFISPAFSDNSYKPYQFRTKTEQEVINALQEIDPLVYCLMEHESHFNGDKLGKAGEIGWLQFMPATYVEQCVNKYHYSYYDIKNLATQIRCARQIIAANGLKKWTTKKFCLQFAEK